MSKQCEPTFKLTLGSPNYRFNVLGPGEWENEASLHGKLGDWNAVVDEEEGGIIAYFGDHEDAWSFVDMMRVKHNCDGIAALYERAHNKD